MACIPPGVDGAWPVRRAGRMSREQSWSLLELGCLVGEGEVFVD
jgi:hypothetical protein